MARIEDAELAIKPVSAGLAAWWVDASWMLVVPYWEVGSWFCETVELRSGTGTDVGEPVLRWRSKPWPVTVGGPPPDGTNYRIRREVPSQLVGPAVLDVESDRFSATPDVVDLFPGASVIRIGVDRRLDVLHAVVAVSPVGAEGDSVFTRPVEGQYGAVL